MINVHNVTKNYIKYSKVGFLKKEKAVVEAVKSISFHVAQGEILGLIGLNGAGKSTTIKMLTGIIAPTAGTLQINQVDPFKDRKSLSNNIGVLFGHRNQLFWDLKVKDSLDFYGHIYSLSKEAFNLKIKEIDQYLDISSLFNKNVRQLSLGQKMRANFAIAFLHNPKIVFLDEPTIGLDVIVKKHVREFLKYINQTYRTTIVITSHDMDDIALLADHIILLNKGEIKYDGNIGNLYALYEKNNLIKVTLPSPKAAVDFSKALLPIAEITDAHCIGDVCNFAFDTAHYDYHAVLALLLALPISSSFQNIELIKPTLENTILKIYG